MGRRVTTRKYILFTIILCVFVSGLWSDRTAADETKTSSEAPVTKILAERFSMDFRTLAYGTVQEPAASSQNPGNSFLQIPRYLGDLELRPDLRFSADPLDLSAKPRMRLELSDWNSGIRDGDTDWDNDWYVNEWLARLKMRENLFLSYGRENLQWGPSFLFSPSNPFFPDNGRRNPYLEVPGMDFARLVFLPASFWTVSLIANTDEGRNKITGPAPFEKTYSLKVDYTGRENYASTIFSHRQDSGKNSLGFFGGWTVSDAVLLYAEGALTQGSKALYPQKDYSPLGASLQPIYQSNHALTPVILIGGSYTFESKGTLTLEYAHNGAGLSDAQADRYYILRQAAANQFGGGPLSGLAAMSLGQAADTGLKFLRRNYALLQYTQNNIMNNIDLTLRLTQNLDDGSCQLTPLVTYSLGNHLELFSVSTLDGGNKNTEFGSILDYQLMMGVKYTF
ncbi:MAG TPA: hypothetical protein VMT62_00505 [Syntrophorhabdaceae bacterium]|nr:hypothetical protein [Syntrophorhabdaceae bacterium]